MTCNSLSRLALLLAAAFCLGAQDTGLERVRAIQDPEKRSREALVFARTQFDRALDMYGAYDTTGGKGALQLVADAVEMAVDSLRSTGKHPRRHPRHFKRAEIQTRKLLEQLREARGKAHLQDQADFDGPIDRIEDLNATLLLGIMSPRK